MNWSSISTFGVCSGGSSRRSSPRVGPAASVAKVYGRAPLDGTPSRDRLWSRRIPVASGGPLLSPRTNSGVIAPHLQVGKEGNVVLVARIPDGVVVGPNQTFTHHHTVGRPNRRRGLRLGLELRNGEPTGSVGGGLCQISNSFHWVAIRSGMRIVERHGHGLDLFPDHRSTCSSTSSSTSWARNKMGLVRTTDPGRQPSFPPDLGDRAVHRPVALVNLEDLLGRG